MLDDNWPDGERRLHTWGAIEALHHAFETWSTSTTPTGQASALVDLTNALGDMFSWHPGWEVETATMPWQRENGVS